VFTLGLAPIGSLVGGVLIDTVGGTTTLALLGAWICLVGLAFTQVPALRRASLAPPDDARGAEVIVLDEALLP
jgi:hypothetical protein